MIRKMLVIAAAVAMPAAAMAGITGLAGSGVASAKALPPTAISCTESGLVTFSKPGLSYAGTVTSKTSEKTKAAVTPAGTGCAGKAIKSTITDNITTPIVGPYGPGPVGTCATVGTTINGGLGPQPPADVPACDARTGAKILKDPNYYDTVGSFATGGTSELQQSLVNGLGTTDNGTKVILAYGTAGEVLPGGVCGSAVGFALTGDVDSGTLGSPGTYTQISDTNGPLTYADNICLTTDTLVAGTGTATNFLTDLALASGGGTQVIATATIGGSSSLVISD